MWKDILKGRGRGGKTKKLNFSFLKEVSLGLAEGFKGRTLSRDEFLDFLEQIRIVYTVKHKSIPLDRIRTTIVTILKRNNLLEVKSKKLGPEEFRREERYYIFKE